MTRALVLCALVGCRLHFDEVPGAPGASDASIDAIDGAANIMTITVGDRPTSQRTGVMRDTFLDEIAPASNWGAADNASVSGQSGFTSHGLLLFDLSSIAPQTRVTRAELELALLDFGDQSVGEVALYEVAESWVEGTNDGTAGPGATWTSRDTNQAWTTPGGVRGAKLAGPLVPVNPLQIAISIATVQRWIDQPSTNVGVMIVPEDPQSSVHYHFKSREHVTEPERPQLTLDVEL